MATSKERRREKERRRTPSGTKRRRSRLVPIVIYVLVCLGLAWFFESQATTTIIFVRNADVEAAAAANGDPVLSVLGRRRAELLADALQDIDVVAGVDAIYASEFRRTQQTAAPVARRLELDVRITDPYQIETFMGQLLREHKGEIVLVVTHGDILAPLVEELHGSKNIPAMDDVSDDNIYIVTIPWFGKVKTLRLHYGLLLPPMPGSGPFTDTL
ncbi:MAG: histidine phosphatase family protein [Gammaproteobacteria bacterium]|nr:histidine phosphatase family protein [Gammaproteobacteria bacterium]MDH3507567.1 histidine phosphatase family protein [Gammaproteobacteria bacterium]